MPIDYLELMEFFTDRVLVQPLHRRSVARPMVFGDETESFFEEPSPELASPATTMSELLNGEPDLIHAAIARWRAAGHEEQLVAALEAIAEFLDRHGDPQATMHDAKAERLQDFVYPVF